MSHRTQLLTPKGEFVAKNRIPPLWFMIFEKDDVKIISNKKKQLDESILKSKGAEEIAKFTFNTNVGKAKEIYNDKISKIRNGYLKSLFENIHSLWLFINTKNNKNRIKLDCTQLVDLSPSDYDAFVYIMNILDSLDDAICSDRYDEFQEITDFGVEPKFKMSSNFESDKNTFEKEFGYPMEEYFVGTVLNKDGSRTNQPVIPLEDLRILDSLRELDYLRQIKSSPGMLANGLITLAKAYRLKPDFENAMKYFNEAIQIWKKNNRLINSGHTYVDLGKMYFEMGWNKEAVNSFNNAIQSYREKECTYYLAITFEAFAEILNNMGEKEKTSEMYQRSLEQYSIMKQRKGTGTKYDNILLDYHERIGERKVIEIKLRLKTIINND